MDLAVKHFSMLLPSFGLDSHDGQNGFLFEALTVSPTIMKKWKMDEHETSFPLP